MSLRVWLPLNGNLDNQGLENVTATGDGSKFIDGKVGKAYNSSTDISVTVPSMQGKKAWSYCFWGYVVSSQITSNWTLIATLNDNGSSLRIEVCPKNYERGVFCYSTHNNTNYNITTGSIKSPTGGYYDQWAHFCLTSDGTTISKYMNGVLVGTCTYNGSGAINGIFTLNNSNKIYKNDFRIYDHCLSPKEVKEISKGLCLHYKLGGIGGENLMGISNLVKRTDNTIFEVVGNDVTVRGKQHRCAAQYTLPVALKSSTVYTLSFEVKQIVNPSTSMGIFVCNQNTSGSWTYPNKTFTSVGKYRYTFTTAASITHTHVDININDTGYPLANECKVVFSSIKLEEGSIATPWCPAPSDALYSSLGFNNNIEYDLSGFKNNGTKVGTIKWSSDTPRYSGSYEFGANKYINVGQAKGKMPTDAITVACWAKLDDWNTTTAMRLISCTEAGGWQLAFNETAGCLSSAMYKPSVGYSRVLYSKGGIGTGWHHCAFTYNGEAHILYVDGVEVTRNAYSTKEAIVYNATSPLLVSGEPTTTVYESYSWLGNLSDLRIYATALSADDIKELYETGAIATNSGALMAYEMVEE